MKAKITKVKIGYTKYTVRFVKDFIGADKNIGETSITKGEFIVVKNEKNRLLEKETLLHEVMHAADYYIGAGMTERQTLGMSSILFTILKENKRLLKYLFEGEGEG